MLRFITNTDEGHITKFIPDVWTPKLVLSADFQSHRTIYRLFRYGNIGLTSVWFAIYNDGHREDFKTTTRRTQQ
jgi:hypothetical protein